MKRTFSLLTIMLIATGWLSAQKFDSAISRYANQATNSKIYIQYDKEYYVPGETIWFKAYFYLNGKPGNSDNNLYLEFTDSKGKVITNKKYPVMGAVAKGNIDLPDTLSQGNYYVRAFTPGTLNADDPIFYTKNIFIFKPTATKTTSANPVLSIKFFPESGQLVDGIGTVTAFKAVDQWGEPMDVNGTIKTEDGTVITNFKSYHDGIGKVVFVPKAGKKYIAEVETPAGKRTYPLPEVMASGVNLRIENEKGGVKLQLARSDKNAADFEPVTLIAEINNQIVFENEIAFEGYPSVIGHIVTDSLPSGILHFTVFNKAGLPLAERLAFVDNKEYSSAASIITSRLSVEKRGSNEFEIQFPEAMQRSLSASVIALPAFSFNDNDNIISRFLLTSDLKGYIHNAAWYFAEGSGASGDHHGDSTAEALDNLMLTHGWSRFNWTKILSGQFADKKFYDPPFISIQGQVVDEKTKQSLAGGKLNLFLTAGDSTEHNYETNVDDKGFFRIDSLIFNGRSQFYYGYTGTNGKTRQALVVMDPASIEKMTTAIISDITNNNIQQNPELAAQNKQELDGRYEYAKAKLDEVKELEKVTVQAKSNKKPIEVVNEKYTSGVFRQSGAVNLDNINSPANDKSQNVVDYVKNNVQAIEIQSGQFVNRKNMSLMTGKKWLVGVFIDEAPANIGLLQSMRMGDVALIKFWEAGFVGVGSEYPGGALAVYTKEKNKDMPKPDKLNYFEYNGYSITKEFYNPDYSPVGPKQPLTDNRTTLYWNPDLYTDADSKSAKLYFFNNDISKRFKVVVEGFDASGKLVHVERVVGN